MDSSSIKDFYDEFASRQAIAGVNERHHLILDLAMAEGLKSDWSVLELGCGIGTLTSLLAPRVPEGSLVAMDLSPESIARGKALLAERRNVVLQVADVVTEPLGGPFDLIVLPDILEHIPFERHSALFRNMVRSLAPAGKILIHSPDPYYSEWLRTNRPGSQQVVDLALHLPELLPTVVEAGLCLLRFQRHSIWTEQPDYMALTLTHTPVVQEFTPIPIQKRTLIGRLASFWSRTMRKPGPFN